MTKRKADFFSDLATLAIKEVFDEMALDAAAGFFEDCDRLKRDELKAAEQSLRYRLRRERNAMRARRVYSRFIRVMAYNSWAATQYIQPDTFGDHHYRYQAVKTLENKRLRIAWVLWCMYHQWMFDELAPGAKRYGKRYSMHRARWYKLHEKLQERIKQDKWDRKRARVKARREKRKYSKRNAKRTADETLAILKSARVQDIITNSEPLSDLPMGSESVAVFICRRGLIVSDSGLLPE